MDQNEHDQCDHCERSPEQDALATALMLVIAELKEVNRDRAKTLCRQLEGAFANEFWGPFIVSDIAHKAFCPAGGERIFDEAAKEAKTFLHDRIRDQIDAHEALHNLMGCASILEEDEHAPAPAAPDPTNN